MISLKCFNASSNFLAISSYEGIVTTSIASLLENKVIASSVAFLRFLNARIFPCDFCSPRILLVLENA
ncbi:hypothetical protein D3C80_2200110 [compost metagenome]